MRQAVRSSSKIRTPAVEPLEGRRLLASIAGSVFTDANFNATRELAEQPFVAAGTAGTAYLDANRNDILDAGEVTTPFSGEYRFLNVPAGKYAVRIVVPNSGLMLTTTPLPADVTVSTTIGLDAEYKGPTFGLATRPADGTILGYEYRDEDNSGTPTDADLFGGAYYGTIFLDTNDNAVIDAGEQRAVVDRQTGRFGFYNLPFGRYTVRAAPQFIQLSLPATQSYTVMIGNGVRGFATGLPFAYTKTALSVGVEFYNDANANGTRESGERGIGYSVGAYLDTNNDSVRQKTEPTLSNVDTIGYFAGIPDGTYTVRPLGGTAYTATRDSFSVTVNSTTASPRVQLGFIAKPQPATVTGTVFRDANNNANREPAEGTVSGIRVYLDADNDGQYDTGETSVFTDSAGGYTLPGTPNSTVTVRLGASLSASYAQSLPRLNGGRVVTLNASGPVTGQDFGAVPLGQVYGRLYDDKNANNVYDSGDGLLDNVVVYADLNNDGQPQPGEPTQTTLDGGGFAIGGVIPGTYALRQITPAGYKAVTGPRTFTINGNAIDLGLFAFVKLPTPPAPATLKGFAFDDKDKDGVYDTNETKTANVTVYLDADNDNALDAGETKTTTLADGSYTFANLAAGTYRVRRLYAAGTVASGKLIDVTVAAGQTLTNLALGSKSTTVTPPATASLSGTVYIDHNKNAKFDSGDGVGKGIVVFLDTDNDGKLDAGEKTATADSRGRFTFATLAAGTYRVRRVMPAGYTYSGPKPDVTLTAGQTKTGVLIGTKKA